MQKARAEKIGVVVMFIVVLVVFSLAERDTKKLTRLQSKTANGIQLKKELTTSEIAEKPATQLLTRN